MAMRNLHVSTNFLRRGEKKSNSPERGNLTIQMNMYERILTFYI